MVVVVSCPPGCVPVRSSGLRFPRAADRAAVYPAGPEPRMITWYSSISISSRERTAGGKNALPDAVNERWASGKAGPSKGLALERIARPGPGDRPTFQVVQIAAPDRSSHFAGHRAADSLGADKDQVVLGEQFLGSRQQGVERNVRRGGDTALGPLKGLSHVDDLEALRHQCLGLFHADALEWLSLLEIGHDSPHKVSPRSIRGGHGSTLAPPPVSVAGSDFPGGISAIPRAHAFRQGPPPTHTSAIWAAATGALFCGESPPECGGTQQPGAPRVIRQGGMSRGVSGVGCWLLGRRRANQPP